VISIIVTVYNIGKYLSACVESILKSTYRDFEVILVDDGSSDGSAAICDDMSQDERVRVIHQENKGVSAARNAGLDSATGDYIMFVDGDDLIHPNMLQVLINAIQEGDYDASMVYGVQVMEGGHEQYTDDKELGLVTKSKVLSQSNFLRGLFGTSGSEFQYIVVWNKLYKCELVQDIQFQKTGSEDLEWSLQMGLKTQTINCIEARMYYWIQHPTSITHKGINPVQIDRINTYLQCLDDIPQEKSTYRSWCLEKLYKVLLHTRHNAMGSQYEDEVKTLVKFAYQKTRKEYLSCTEMGFMKKYGLLGFYNMPFLYNMFMNWKKSRIKKRVRSKSGVLYVQDVDE